MDKGAAKAIVATIISVAHHLNMRVIAEGVETEDQLHYLIENGCDDIQGFFFSPPMSAEQLQGAILSRKIDRGGSRLPAQKGCASGPCCRCTALLNHRTAPTSTSSTTCGSVIPRFTGGTGISGSRPSCSDERKE
ncbi:EAL domain-containing protein [Paenibacillus thiaminolyticus]|uniref:EAL domain-containing protein n=1 Tax=Paenibacillus thiaminolyticus TaxID=49283 RepID=UPI0021758B49|nr:EAL domain-containing protein [Paenibacillus thiaminolyticus]